MLARIVIDPEALGDTTAPIAMTKFHHNSLLETLAAYGYLVFANNEEAAAFSKALRNRSEFPPGMAEKWATVFPELYKLGRVRVVGQPDDPPISQVRHLAGLQRGWKGNVDVAVMGTAGAAAIGISEAEGILDDADSHVELATVVATPHTRTISRYRELAETAVVPYDAARDTFWNDVLAPVATASKKVTVLDGYLLTTLWNKEDNLPGSRTRPAEQVQWLLQHLDTAMKPGSEVELICAYEAHKSYYDADASADMIRDYWSPPREGNLTKVTLTLVKRQRGFTHDRHIRFSTGVALTFAAGLDRLRSPHVWDEDGMTWAYKWRREAINGLREREERAKSFSPRQTVTVFQR